MAGAEREHDVVVYGATGFVGALTAAYLAEHAPPGTAIALGGRSQEKLEKTRAQLGPKAAGMALVVADTGDPEALKAMAEASKVVATTVGPYDRYGLPVVEACAAAGTHYADLTGEPTFMRRSIDTAHETASASGARIVHAAGFDSIPSDIGVLLLHEHAKANGLGELGDTSLVVNAMRGGASGGTIDSMRGIVDLAKRDKQVRKMLFDPFALAPDRSDEPAFGTVKDPVGVIRDPELGGWFAPFFMGTTNSRVVYRSNALQDHAYGRDFRYRELMQTRGVLAPAKAAGVVGGMGALMGGMAFKPTRKLLDRVLPDPGEGPSEKSRERGFFKISTHTTTSTGAKLICKIAAQGDPGYKATAVMFGEAALAMALDEDKLPEAAGVLTPATAIGTTLADRLRAAGHSYDVVAG
jgi:short subunit dehydrogenase-like uncharacterized protein